MLLFIQAAVLAALTWFELIGPGLIILMSVSIGVLNAFDTPLRQSLIPVMVGGRDDLPNALALNAMLFNLGRLIGPPIAGLMLGFMSEAACFLLNAFSYLALLWGVAAMRLTAMRVPWVCCGAPPAAGPLSRRWHWRHANRCAAA